MRRIQSAILIAVAFSLLPLARAQTPGTLRYDGSDLVFYDNEGWKSTNNEVTADDCSSSGSTPGTVRFDHGNTNTLQFCNGTNWVSMSAAPGLETCTSGGRVRYSASHRQLQYCSGANWVNTSPVLAGAPSNVAKGYFVLLSAAVPSGALGGLTGADEKCRQDLENKLWLGKGEAGFPTLATARAFLCDDSVCRNLAPNTTYAFALSGSTTTGGGTFTTNDKGQGPGNLDAWSASTAFGNAGTYYYWTGRALGTDSWWSDLASGNSCGGWTTTSGTGKDGDATMTDAWRWSNVAENCNYNGSRIICYVHPNQPATFTFIDQVKLSLSTTIDSNIIKIMGLPGPSTVRIEGTQGTPQLRVCSDATCSIGTPTWTSTSTSISNGQYLQLRMTTSAGPETTHTVRAVVGTAATTWKITTGGTRPTGYFVLTAQTYNGNLTDGSLTGLAAANSRCLSQLTGNEWMGKSSAGTLDGTTVKAFLCDGANCNNLDSWAKYQFAVAASPLVGGAMLKTDGSGLGPNDRESWSGPAYFGSEFAYYWTGRDVNTATQWATTPFASNNCLNWTNSQSSNSARDGLPGAADSRRWSDMLSACNSAFHLICAVKPN